MKWIAVVVKIGNDPSVGHIADAVKVKKPHAVGMCVLVYCELPGHARDGDISGIPDSTLEEWAKWHGARGVFAKAFRQHLCDEDGVVRAWDKHNGAAIRENDNDRERKAELRRKSAGSPPDKGKKSNGQPLDRPTDLTRDVTGTLTKLPLPSSAAARVEACLSSEEARTAFAELLKRTPGHESFAMKIEALAGAREWPSKIAVYSWPIVESAMIDLAQKNTPVTSLPGYCRIAQQRASGVNATISEDVIAESTRLFLAMGEGAAA